MTGYLKRLLTATAAYQVADVVAKVLALGLLPVYTRHLTPGDYGVAELLVSLVIFVSIVVRLGLGEAFVRYWYEAEDEAARTALARRSWRTVFLTTTAVAVPAALLSGPLSRLLLDRDDAATVAAAVLGLWAFTNLELAYALLRVEERVRRYATASCTNVALTVVLTVILVVGLDAGAKGLLFGTYGASSIVLLGLWWSERARLLGPLRPEGAPLNHLLRFGAPTVPADASVFALNLVDRWWLFHQKSPASAGLYALGVKLAGAVVFAVRAFQYAWPPLAYSVVDDTDASRLYALVTTYYVLAVGWIVAALTLFSRPLVRVLAAPAYAPAHRALPWVALGWALYGLVLVLVAVAGRAKITTRNAPAALAGLAVNVALLALLVPGHGAAGAGAALCGAYLVMLTVLHQLTRRLFPVAFEWRRLAHVVAVLGGVTVLAELALPTRGAGGFVARLAALAAMPALIVATGFLRPEERTRLVALARRARTRYRPAAAA